MADTNWKHTDQYLGFIVMENRAEQFAASDCVGHFYPLYQVRLKIRISKNTVLRYRIHTGLRSKPGQIAASKPRTTDECNLGTRHVFYALDQVCKERRHDF